MSQVLVEASASTPTSPDVIIQKRNSSVQSLKKMFFKFFKVFVKNPFKLFSRVVSINEFKSLMEIAGTVHSSEKGTRLIHDNHIITGVFEGKACGKTAINLLSASTMEQEAPDRASKAAEELDKTSPTPKGKRWAVAAEGVDLSGEWQLCADDQFKKDYDRYLANLGQPLLVRTVALGLVGRTKEELRMSDSGKSLVIIGENARGIWERELITSGTEVGKPEFEPLHFPIMTADSEKVEAESWWEYGTVHVSLLNGVSRYYGGGTFESRRYLEDDGNTYVCVSTFRFKDVSRKPNRIEWRFRKIQE